MAKIVLSIKEIILGHLQTTNTLTLSNEGDLPERGTFLNISQKRL